MAGIIGPSNKLPGQSIPFKRNGTQCDECEHEADHEIVGETDSFGSETMHLCNGCYVKFRAQENDAPEKLERCDICNQMQTNCELFRDPAEGSTGPVYRGCLACRSKIIADFCCDTPDDTDFLPEDDIDYFSNADDYLPDDYDDSSDD